MTGASALDPVQGIVVGYLLDRIRDVPGVEPLLLERAVELYRLVEAEHAARRGGLDAEGIRTSTAFRAATALLGARVRRLADVGVRLASDNRRLMTTLRRRLADLDLDPADPAQRPAAEEEYERLLAATVPLDVSLENVAAVADTLDLANDLLNPRSRVARAVLPAAVQALLPLVVSGADLRARADELRRELTGQPERLAALAAAVREAGPEIVRAAYRRGSAAAGKVLPSADRRTAE